MLERVGISLEDSLLAQFDRLIKRRGYANRSEAVRDLHSRTDGAARVDRARQGQHRRSGVMLVYDHDSSSLAQKAHAHPARAPWHRGLGAARAPRSAQLSEVLILRGGASEILSMGEAWSAPRA